MEVIPMGVSNITVCVKGILLVYVIVFSMHIQNPIQHITLSILEKQFMAISAGIYLLKVNSGKTNNVWNVFNPLVSTQQNGQTHCRRMV